MALVATIASSAIKDVCKCGDVCGDAGNEWPMTCMDMSSNSLKESCMCMDIPFEEALLRYPTLANRDAICIAKGKRCLQNAGPKCCNSGICFEGACVEQEQSKIVKRFSKSGSNSINSERAAHLSLCSSSFTPCVTSAECCQGLTCSNHFFKLCLSTTESKL